MTHDVNDAAVGRAFGEGFFLFVNPVYQLCPALATQS